MDDSVRAEYQRRLDAGDKEGALGYLRMLRTQTDDPAARAAYQQAIDGIEGGGATASDTSTAAYGGSAGPFGDNAGDWAAAHQAHESVTAGPADSGQSGAGGVNWDTGAGSFGTPSAPSSQAPSAPSSPPPAAAAGHGATHPSPSESIGAGIGSSVAGALGLGGQVGGFIGDRVQHAIDNVTGHGAPVPPPPAAKAHDPAAPQHHGFLDNVFGHKDATEPGSPPVQGETDASSEQGGGSTV